NAGSAGEQTCLLGPPYEVLQQFSRQIEVERRLTAAMQRGTPREVLAVVQDPGAQLAALRMPDAGLARLRCPEGKALMLFTAPDCVAAARNRLLGQPWAEGVPIGVNGAAMVQQMPLPGKDCLGNNPVG